MKKLFALLLAAAMVLGLAACGNKTDAPAGDDNKGEEKKCDFITVVAWKQTADFICRYFKKGQAMLVCGELQTRSWQDNNGNKRYATEVVASEVSFCEAKRESEGNNARANHSAAQSQFSAPAYVPEAYANFEAVNADNDLPF